MSTEATDIHFDYNYGLYTIWLHHGLYRWREKVYELLVKQQCSELVYRDEVKKWNDKVNLILINHKL